MKQTLWHIGGAILFVGLVALQRRARSSGILVMALWNLAGVVLHEAAHFVAGLLLGAGPTGFSLVPRRRGKTWELGSVSFARITPLNAIPVALAPLCLAGLAYWLAQQWFKWYHPSFGSTLALYAVVYVFLYNALPSRRDLQVACNWKGLLFYAVLAAVVWYLVGYFR